MPMAHIRRDKNHIARPHFLDFAARLLDPAEPGGDDQDLTNRMSMPIRARARFERDTNARHLGRHARGKERVETDGANEVRWLSCPRRTRAVLQYLHGIGSRRLLSNGWYARGEQQGCGQ